MSAVDRFDRVGGDARSVADNNIHAAITVRGSVSFHARVCSRHLVRHVQTLSKLLVRSRSTVRARQKKWANQTVPLPHYPHSAVVGPRGRDERFVLHTLHRTCCHSTHSAPSPSLSLTPVADDVSPAATAATSTTSPRTSVHVLVALTFFVARLHFSNNLPSVSRSVQTSLQPRLDSPELQPLLSDHRRRSASQPSLHQAELRPARRSSSFSLPSSSAMSRISDANYGLVQSDGAPNSQMMSLAGPIDPPKPRPDVKDDEWNMCCPSTLSCFASTICPCIWCGCCVQVDYNTEAVFLNYGKVSRAAQPSLIDHSPARHTQPA